MISVEARRPRSLFIACRCGVQVQSAREARASQPLRNQTGIAEQRLSQASNGNVIVGLKTPYDDGTTHVVLSPLEFIGRLVALVPRPRVNLTRFHGVFSPNSKLRQHVVPPPPVEQEERSKPKAYSMTWADGRPAQRLKRVFAIEIEKCEKCLDSIDQFGES